MRKDTLVRAIENLPEEFRIDDLIEKLMIVQRVEEAERSLAEGKGISHSEVAKHLRELLKQKRDGGSSLVA